MFHFYSSKLMADLLHIIGLLPMKPGAKGMPDKEASEGLGGTPIDRTQSLSEPFLGMSCFRTYIVLYFKSLSGKAGHCFGWLTRWSMATRSIGGAGANLRIRLA